MARIEETAEIHVSFGPHNPTLLTLIGDWASNVLKFHSDLERNWHDPDPTIWGGDDLAGACHLRDAIETGLDLLEVAKGSRNVALLMATDELFRSFTVEDLDQRLSVLDPNARTGSGWWWHRIPIRGPIVQQLDEYWHATESGEQET